jgi:hypothetical protein
MLGCSHLFSLPPVPYPPFPSPNAPHTLSVRPPPLSLRVRRAPTALDAALPRQRRRWKRQLAPGRVRRGRLFKWRSGDFPGEHF